MNFKFQNPESFQILWMLPVFILVTWFVWRRQAARVRRALGDRLTPFLTSTVSKPRRTVKFILELAVLALMVVALARPQQGIGKTEVKARGVELIIALDVSNSMLAEDHKPSRLEHAKREINRLLDQLSGDKVALMAFAGTAVVVAPLTADYSSIRMFVDSLSPESVSTQGTSFKKVIDEAQESFRRGGLADEEGSKITRVLLIATDGEIHDPEALKAAESVSTKKGIRIFTLGFGTRKGAPIPERDPRGNLLGYKKDKSGQVIVSSANDDVLIRLAKAGRGSYNHATFTGEEILSIKADLDRLDKSEFETTTMTTYNEKYQPFLLLAFLLAVVELSLGERRGVGRLWKGRFEVAES